MPDKIFHHAAPARFAEGVPLREASAGPDDALLSAAVVGALPVSVSLEDWLARLVERRR